MLIHKGKKEIVDISKLFTDMQDFTKIMHDKKNEHINTKMRFRRQLADCVIVNEMKIMICKLGL